jgi:hypothetical protein
LGMVLGWGSSGGTRDRGAGGLHFVFRWPEVFCVREMGGVGRAERTVDGGGVFVMGEGKTLGE